jgi:hypothetical protein
LTLILIINFLNVITGKIMIIITEPKEKSVMADEYNPSESRDVISKTLLGMRLNLRKELNKIKDVNW